MTGGDADRGHPDADQVFGGQLRQDLAVDIVVAERRYIAHRGRGPAARAACSASRDDALGHSEIAMPRTVAQLNSEPAKSENLPSRCAFRPQQFAGNCIRCERRLIGEARRAFVGTTQAVGQRVTPLFRRKAAISTSRSW